MWPLLHAAWGVATNWRDYKDTRSATDMYSNAMYALIKMSPLLVNSEANKVNLPIQRCSKELVLTYDMC